MPAAPLFIELYTKDTHGYIAFFQRVAGYSLVRDEGHFVELRSGGAAVLLNAQDDLPDGHPFRNRLGGPSQGVGVEIGIITDDLTAAHRAAAEFEGKGWSVTEIGSRSWGLSDFRVVSPDGYYFRITDPRP